MRERDNMLRIFEADSNILWIWIYSDTILSYEIEMHMQEGLYPLMKYIFESKQLGGFAKTTKSGKKRLTLFT